MEKENELTDELKDIALDPSYDLNDYLKAT